MKGHLSLSVVIPLDPSKNAIVLDSLESQSFPTEVIIEKGSNPSRNRNKGIEKAKTDLVAFVNAHSVIPKDWAEKVISFFEKNPSVDVVGGPQLTPPGSSFFERASGYALSSLFGSSIARTRYKKDKILSSKDEMSLTSSNLICRKHVFKKVKFDENLYPGEDPKFLSDLLTAGFNLDYNPEIFVYNKRRDKLLDLSRQVFNYGYVRPFKENFSSTLKKPSFLVPSLFLLYLVLAPIAYNFTKLSLVPLGLYIFLNIYFSIYESLINGEIKASIIMPLIFLSIHVSYGLGFIWGNICKIRRVSR